MSPVTLGIDIGTTSVKAVLLDDAGRVAAIASSEHGIVRHPGVVEAAPGQWWQSVLAALGRLGPRLDEVVAVGLTGNMSSVVLLDRRGEALGNAPLLADSRGERQLAALPPEVRDLVFARTGNRPATAFSLSTLLHLRDEGTLDQVQTWVSAKDYVRLRLTGVIGTDLTDAYNSLLIRAGGDDWDPDLIDAVGLPKRILPPIRPSAEPAGTVKEDIGIPAGVPVVTGAGDVAAAALGAGAVRPGDVLISLGTSVTVLAPVGQPPGDGRTYHPSASGWPGLALASLLTGGLALNWLRGLLADPATDGDPLAADDPLVFLPHLAGTGSPDFLPFVHGSLVGLRPSTSGADVRRALFEAIGFEIAEALDAGQDGDILASGGGTRIPAWVQTLADILGRPVIAGEDPDVSAIGAARLAWEGLTGGPPPRPVRAETRYEPVAERAGPSRRRAANYYRTRDHMTAYYSSAGNPTP